MPFHQPDSVRYYTFDSLDEAGITHAIFTRQGGVSPPPWASLNVGGLRGDDPARVTENRMRSFQAIGRAPQTMYDVHQIHSTEVICATAPRPLDVSHRKADAILTDRPEVTLFMRFADCVPILLFDPRRRVVGLVHAGWLGTVKGVVNAVVAAMQARYLTNPRDILAAIGPSIAAHHYEIGLEVVVQVQQAFGEDASALLRPVIAAPMPSLPPSTASQLFDLWAANRLLLERAGVKHIEVAGICTACNLHEWYSHRGEHGQTGRFGALIVLK